MNNLLKEMTRRVFSPEVPFEKLKSSKAWILTSEYVRRKALIKGTEDCRCYTCSAVVPYKKTHAGHLIEKRGNASIYFNLNGIRAQCPKCNRYLHGNKDIFVLKLYKEIGAEKLVKLYKESHKTKRWRKIELEEIAEKREKDLEKLKALTKLQ